MADGVTAADAAWFAARTDGAPDALRQRAGRFFTAAADGDRGGRLAAAARNALDESMTAGAGRAAALDLLAADALITLALLAHAEQHPERLADVAASLRAAVAGAA